MTPKYYVENNIGQQIINNLLVGQPGKGQ
jgi:hypothetical protein